MILKLKRTPGIYVVGFMGAGKTTVGRHLAHRLGWSFFDTDEEIEAAEKTAIAEIFAVARRGGVPPHRNRHHRASMCAGSNAAARRCWRSAAAPSPSPANRELLAGQRHQRLAGLPLRDRPAARRPGALTGRWRAIPKPSPRSTPPAASTTALADVHITGGERRSRDHRGRHPANTRSSNEHPQTPAPPRRHHLPRRAGRRRPRRRGGPPPLAAATSTAIATST